MLDSEEADWAMGEAFAFGSLLMEDVHVRLSGTCRVKFIVCGSLWFVLVHVFVLRPMASTSHKFPNVIIYTMDVFTV